MSGIPYTTPMPLPKHLEHQPKKPVATQLVGAEWMVCAEVKPAVEIEPKQWENDKELLDACPSCRETCPSDRD